MNILFSPNQHIVIIGMIITGCFLGVFYDLLKIKRMIFGSFFVLLFIDDILFSFISLFVFLLCAFVLNSGIVRWFEFICCSFGFFIYRITASKILIKTVSFIVRLIKTLLYKIFIVFIFKPVYLIIKPFFYCLVRLWQMREINNYIHDIKKLRM